MLPLTSTTHTKSIGGLSILFSNFLVLTVKTAGTTYIQLLILLLSHFTGFLSGLN